MADDKKLEVKITATTSSLTAGMKEAESTVQNSISQMQGLFASMSSSVSGTMQAMAASIKEHVFSVQGAMVELAAAIGSGALIKESINKNLEYNESLLQMSRTMGMTTEAAGVMTTALKLIGSNSESYIAANMKLDRQLKTNEAGLNQLGVATRGANGSLLDQQTLFKNALSAMMEYKEGTDRNEAAMTLFGRGAKEAMQFLKLNDAVMAEATELAHAYGLAIGDDAARQTEEYGIQLNAAGLIFDGVKLKIGQELLPVMVQLAGWFGQIGPTAMKVTVVAIKATIQVFEGLVLIVRDVWNVGEQVFKQLANLIAGVAVTVKTVLVGAFQTALDLVTGIMGTLVAALKKLLSGEFSEAWVELKNGVSNTMTQMGTNVESTVKQTGAVVKGTVKSMQTDWKDFAENVVTYHKDAQQRVDQIWAGTGTHIAQAMQQGTKAFKPDDSAAKFQEAVGRSIVATTKIQVKQQQEAEDEAARAQEVKGKLITAGLIGEYKIRAEQEKEMFALVDAEAQHLADDEAAFAAQARLRRVAEKEQEAKDVLTIQERMGKDIVAASIKQYKDQEAAAKAWSAMVANLTQPVANAFSQMTTGILRGNQTWQQATQRLLENLASSYVSMAAQTLITWTQTELAKTAATAAGTEARTGIAEAGALSAMLATAAGSIKDILNAAWKASADTFAFLAPAGPEVAIPGAAAVFTLVSGFAGNVVSAAGGYDVPRDMFAKIHAREMVLPSGLADRVRGMTDASGGDTHIHFAVSAVDAQSVERLLANKGDVLAKVLKQQVRNFKLT